MTSTHIAKCKIPSKNTFFFTKINKFVDFLGDVIGLPLFIKKKIVDESTKLI